MDKKQAIIRFESRVDYYDKMLDKFLDARTKFIEAGDIEKAHRAHVRVIQCQQAKVSYADALNILQSIN